MVFMEDSVRAADLAKQHGVDAALHLNLTAEFSASECSPRLIQEQKKLARILHSGRLAAALYHPKLTASFEYVVRAQLEEFERLYGSAPSRVDGHQHMHLCANIVFQKLLPAGTIVRRNFSFWPGEKSWLNRAYRRWQDQLIAKRHQLADFFFALPPIDLPGRVERMTALAVRHSVEVETHPVRPEEFRFLTNHELTRRGGGIRIARVYRLDSSSDLTCMGAAV